MAQPSTATSLFEQLAKVWQADLIGCPDWLVMPKSKRNALGFGTARAPFNFVEALGSIPVPQRVLLLTLVASRKVICLEHLDDDLESAIATMAIGSEEITSDIRIDLLRILLREARQKRNKSRFLEVDALLATVTAPGSDAYADLISQRLLWARDGLDLAAVSEGLDALQGPDPIWRLIRAALHCECGETELAKPIIEDLRNDLAQRQQMDKRSMSIASRRAWTEVFAGALRMSVSWRQDAIEPPGGVALGYDPEEEINRLHREVRASRLRRSEELTGVQPLFGPGAYQDHGRTITYRSAAFGYEAEAVFRFADASGLPIRIENVDIMVSLARDALCSEPLATLQWHMRLLRTLSHSSPVLEQHYNTVSVARLDAIVATELTVRVLRTMRFWYPRARQGSKFSSVFAIERLRLYTEVLSRLIVRADALTALETFRFGLHMAAEPASTHHWLYEPLDNLLSRSLESLPPEERGERVLDCLELPLPGHSEPVPHDRWPNPIDELFSRGLPPGRPVGDARWTACVARLLAALEEVGSARPQAVTRLAYLATHACLEPWEREEFGRLLWLHRDEARSGLPLDVTLYPHVIATLPGTSNVDPVEVVVGYLFKSFVINNDSMRRLAAISAAARSAPPIISISPARHQAILLLDELAACLSALTVDQSSFQIELHGRLLVSAGIAVSDAILPCLNPGDLTPERLAFVNLCARAENGGRTLAGFHEIARLSPDLTPTIVAALKRAVARGAFLDVEGASRSIGEWGVLVSKGRYPPLPEVLKEAVLAAIERGVGQGLYPRLACARRLLEFDALSPSQIEALHHVLPELWVGLAYEVMPNVGPEAVGITNARAECVRLARVLNIAGYPDNTGITDAAPDPLPEVRYALITGG